MTTVNPLKIAASLILWVALMVFLAAFYWWQWLHTDHRIPKMHNMFVVQSGESLSGVAMRLANIDLIRWPKVWVLYARFYDSAPIKRGEYHFGKHESPISILNKLQSDDVVTYSVTLVEGKRFSDYVKLLSEQSKLDSTLFGLTADKQMEALGLSINHHEGWFFPDTYQYIANDSDVMILRRAYKKMLLELDQQWQGRAVDLPYASPYEALVMASIVEKETGVAYERPEIAGVFVRRLKKNMRLQTDPTVIYGLGDDYKGNLTRAHLKTPSSYNTYTNSGLPPTPIAMPSAAAIEAALNPKEGDTLYFVAKGDGSHYFSKTLDEHNQAVTRFQRSGRAKDYRSSPKPNP